jgi:hypothetical protein
MLFQTMPANTNTKGTAMINMGFINLLLEPAFDSRWVLEEGSEPGRSSLSNRRRSPCHGRLPSPVCYLLRDITASL